MLLQRKLDHARGLSTIMRTKAESALPSTTTTVPPGSSIRIEAAPVRASACLVRASSVITTGISPVSANVRSWY